MKQCIAISGSHGAGTSTTARMIAEALKLRYVSAGDIFREFAEKRGIDISEFTKIVESDTSMNEELDKRIREEAKSGNVIVEGRIACWTAKEFAQLRVMIDAPFDIRVARISKRSGMSISEAEDETSKRDNEEREWFRRKRGIDIDDTSIFDIIISTERMSPIRVCRIILSAI